MNTAARGNEEEFDEKSEVYSVTREIRTSSVLPDLQEKESFLSEPGTSYPEFGPSVDIREKDLNFCD